MFSFLLHPNINPTILQIAGPLAIRWYSLMYIVGFSVVYGFLYYQIKKGRFKITKDQLGDLFFIGMLGVLVGGRLGYILFYNLPYYLHNPLKIFAVWEGGMSFHGGLLFTLLFEWLYIRKHKLDFIALADLFIVPVPLALAAGRWGNFVNGELWGRVTTRPWGMLFPHAPAIPLDQKIVHLGMTARAVAAKVGMTIPQGATAVNLPRHPSQLYELTLEGIVLFLVLYLFYKFKKNAPKGFLISLFFLGYGTARFTLEFFRQPDIQMGHGGFLLGNWLTMGMVLSFPMILFGIWGVWYSIKLNKRNPLWGE